MPSQANLYRTNQSIIQRPIQDAESDLVEITLINNDQIIIRNRSIQFLTAVAESSSDMIDLKVDSALKAFDN